MPKILRADFKLERNENEVYLTKRDGTGPKFDVHPLIAAMIALFNGYRSEEEIVDLSSGIFDMEPARSANLLQKVCKRFTSLVVEREQAGNGQLLNPNETLNPGDFIFKTSPRPTPERFPAPVWLNWVVTCCCHRHCIYCYMDAKKSKSALDSVMSTKEVKRIIDEAADLGVCGIVITGGEPFLRNDLPELLAYILSKNISTYTITKSALDKNTASILKNPLSRLEISFDSPDEKTADTLTGTPGFWREMVESFKVLSAQGVNYTIVPTLTSLNAHQAGELVSFLYQLGIKNFRFARYGRSEGRHRDSLLISDQEWTQAMDKIREERDKICDPLIRINFDKDTCDSFSDDSLLTMKKIDNNCCGNGRHIMIIRHDGKTTLCEKLLDDAWVYGDLRQQSILEAWASPVLQNFLHPSRELFAGADCYNCKVFETCRAKMKCIYFSHILYGNCYVPLPEIAHSCGYYHNPLPSHRDFFQ